MSEPVSKDRDLNMVNMYLCSNIELGIDILQNLECFIGVLSRVSFRHSPINIFMSFTCKWKMQKEV